MAVYVYPVLCVLLASPLFQDVLSQNNKFRNANYPLRDMPLRQRGGFNGGPRQLQQRGQQQSRLMPNRGQLSPSQPLSAQGPSSGIMSPYSPSVAISSADAVLSHRSLGPRGRGPLHTMGGGPLPLDRSQGSFSHAQDMSGGANSMQASPNPWNQPEVHAPGFIQSRGPLVAKPLGGPTLDTLQQQARGPLNKMDSLMIESPKGPLAAKQPQFTEPLVPGFVAESKPTPNQWPSKAPLVASKPLSWTQGLKQPIATLPASILISSGPKYNLASSKPGFQPEAPIVPLKQKHIEPKNKDVRLADINTGSNTFANNQQPNQFVKKPDVKMKADQTNIADYSIIKDTGPTGPLLPGSPAPPTAMYKSTPIDAQLFTGSPLTLSSQKPYVPVNMGNTGITDMVYVATNTPVLTGAPSVGYPSTWTTAGTTMPPVVTTTAPSTTTEAISTTTNAYSQISANVEIEKMNRKKNQVLKELRVALSAVNIRNSGNLYARIEKLSLDKMQAYLRRAKAIQAKKRLG